MIMRYLRLCVLGSLAVLSAAAITAYCCGPYGESLPPRVKVPGQITSGVVHGKNFYAVTHNGNLIAVSLRNGQVKDYGTFDMKLSPIIDVADNKAWVCAKNRLYQVDLASGKIVQAVVTEMEGDINRLGFISEERLWVQGNSSAITVNSTTGKKLTTLDQVKDQEIHRHFNLCACDASCKRMFTFGGESKAELTIVDMDQCKEIDRIATPKVRWDHSGGDLRIVGDKAYILCMRFGYGVWTNSFGYVDLKKREYHALKLPRNNSNVLHASTLLRGSNGTIFLAVDGGVFEYDADGKLLGNVLAKCPGQVVGIHNRLALVAGESTLEFLPLQQAVVEGK